MIHHCAVDQLLKSGKLRCTKDRHELMALLMQERTWSASQISEKVPKMDVSTIYRNLQKLLTANLIRSVHTHTTEEFFERANDTHHDHVACPKCHLMNCIPCPISQLKQSHILEIKRVCEMCA